jgi:23S rRNA (cytosine1962-C5)-methyltransferase
MNVVRLELAKGLGRHLKAGHPWVFRRGLAQVPKLPAGSVVDLTEDSRFVARGYFDPHSAISVRVFTLDPREVIDAGFFRARVKTAYASRQLLLDLYETNGYRLIHGEGDGLPGVVVDLYGAHAVLKLYSAGLNPYRHLIVEALRAEVPGLKGVVGRDETPRDDGPDDEPGTGRILWGEAPADPLILTERGAHFRVDVYHGQKTGFFLDQRENRFLIRRLAAAREVLNCFCFSGGFSVNAALGGATRVWSVDSDEDALALARQNFLENGLPAAKHEFMAADVFKVLTAFKHEQRQFDLVILDPPAFAKSQKAVEAALDGYASLNRQALALLKPGGLLATASCSARVSPEAFQAAVNQAANNAGVSLSLVEERYQPPDHPVRLAFPEGRYLKFLVFQMNA